MSIDAVVTRITQLQTALAPPVPATPTTPQTASVGQFSAMLGAAQAGQVAPTAAVGAGTPGQKMVALAQAEIGVTEQPPGSNDSPRIAQYREATAGSGVGPWCAYFTSFLAKEAGVPLGEQGQGFGLVDAVYAWGQRTGRATPNGPGVTPQPGDLIVFDEHIGLVESVSPDGTVNTIEGNSSHQVIRRQHDAGAALGYVRPG